MVSDFGCCKQCTLECQLLYFVRSLYTSSFTWFILIGLPISATLILFSSCSLYILSPFPDSIVEESFFEFYFDSCASGMNSDAFFIAVAGTWMATNSPWFLDSFPLSVTCSWCKCLRKRGG